jgi:ABC-type xylose transport system substrate-binding protein
MLGRKIAWVALLLVCLSALPQVWAAGGPGEKEKAVTIGVSIGDLRLERWKRDMDYMV